MSRRDGAGRVVLTRRAFLLAGAAGAALAGPAEAAMRPMPRPEGWGDAGIAPVFQSGAFEGDVFV